MPVDLEIFGQLLPGEPRRRTVDAAVARTAREYAAAIGLDAREIGLISIDGIQSGLDDWVHPGSRLCFFPYVSGG